MCRNSGGYQWVLSASVLVVLILGIESMAHGQSAGSNVGACRVSPFSRESSGESGKGSFEVTPSLCVSERYDSNVFFAPPSSGLRRDDFVTNVNPMIRVTHNGDYASGYLRVGGFGETYIKNPDLNYLGTNNTLSLDLDKSIQRLLPKASLNVADTFSYTPLPPGFVNPAAGTSPSDPGNIQNVFAQGILGFRTNNVINSATVSTSYATTASTSLNASYNYAIIRFGSSPSTQGQNLFNTTSQTGTVGGAVRLSPVDALSAKYAHVQTESTPSSPSTVSTSLLFKLDSVTIGWSRTLTPNLKAEVGGGGILINSVQTTYAANAALVMNYLINTATISYAHTAFPTFFGGGVMIGDTFIVSAIQKIDRQWQLAETVSYTHSSSASGLNPQTFDSFVAGGDVQYWMTSNWSTGLSYSYSKFNSESGSTHRDFVRQLIMLSVKATWE